MLKNLLGSRKWVLSTATALLVALNEALSLGLTEAALDKIILVVVAVVGGEAVADALGRLKSEKK